MQNYQIVFLPPMPQFSDDGRIVAACDSAEEFACRRTVQRLALDDDASFP